MDTKPYVTNIEEETVQNDNFRKVLWTGQHSQLVLMSLNPGEVIADGMEYEIRNGSAIVIPAGTEHNIINTSTDRKLKLYTIYSPAHHKSGVIHATKMDAEADHEDHI